MSRIAVHHWQHRIAPVFDIGGRVLVLGGGGAAREEHLLQCPQPLRRAEELHALGVGTLICGAISRSMSEALEARGIAVVGFVAGDLERVLAAWERGGLDDSFAMPGCRCAGRGRHGAAKDRGFGPRALRDDDFVPPGRPAGTGSAGVRLRQRRGGFGGGHGGSSDS